MKVPKKVTKYSINEVLVLRYSLALHIDYLCNKLAKSIGLLQIATQFMFYSILVAMFHAFIMLHICYIKQLVKLL